MNIYLFLQGRRLEGVIWHDPPPFHEAIIKAYYKSLIILKSEAKTHSSEFFDHIESDVID